VLVVTLAVIVLAVLGFMGFIVVVTGVTILPLIAIATRIFDGLGGYDIQVSWAAHWGESWVGGCCCWQESMWQGGYQ
jgi:hypothetical protein